MPGRNRLRVVNNFGQRNVESQSKDYKSAYIVSIAGEGETEKFYFDKISDLYSNIPIEKLITMDDNDTNSHPNHVLALLEERALSGEYDPSELWMIIDRDKQNVSEEQLNNIIATCNEKGYNVGLSNPTFELWLLLHLKDLSDYDVDKVFDNRKVNKNRRFLDKELSTLLDGYSKSQFDFEKIREGIDSAITRAKLLPTDNKELINSLGTSVCLLLEKLNNYQ